MEPLRDEIEEGTILAIQDPSQGGAARFWYVDERNGQRLGIRDNRQMGTFLVFMAGSRQTPLDLVFKIRQGRHRQGIERRVTVTDTATYTGAETLDIAAILVPLRGKMTYGTNLA